MEKRGKGHALTFSTTVAGSTSGKIHIAASEKGIKEETWRNNEDISTLSRRNYRLSVQTQSPLLILSLEDMMLLVEVGGRFRSSRYVLHICSRETEHVSSPDPFKSGRI